MQPAQAFRKGPNLLGLQFHMEADPRRIEAWLIGHAVELAKKSITPSITTLWRDHVGRNRVTNEWRSTSVPRGDAATAPSCLGSREPGMG